MLCTYSLRRDRNLKKKSKQAETHGLEIISVTCDSQTNLEVIGISSACL